jgi:hypothetical protein
MDDHTPTAEGPPAADSREAAARLFEEAAAELDRASAHCRRAAEHFRGDQAPRAAARAWAALGHLREAEQGLEALARAHRLRASV